MSLSCLIKEFFGMGQESWVLFNLSYGQTAGGQEGENK